MALLIAHGLLAWQLRTRGIFTFGDDAAYLLLSRSLHGLSYRELQFVGNPVAARFPPGYPGFLALVTAPAGERFGLISMAGILVSMTGLALLFDVVRRRWTSEIAFLATAATAVNPVVVANAGAIASETLFTTLTLAAVWAADRADRARERRASGSRDAVLTGVFAIAAALTRSAGVTLPLALGAHWLYRRRYRWVLTAGVACALTVGAWLAWTVVAPARTVRRSYVDDAVNVRAADGKLSSTFAFRIKRNVSTYVGQAMLTELALPVTSRTRADNVAWVAVLGTLFGIGVLSAWRRWNAMVWYVTAYSALLAIWAYALERFLDPLLPFVITLIVVGAGVATARAAPRARLLLPAVAALVLAACALGTDAKLVDQASDCDRARVACSRPVALDFLDAVEYLRTHSPPSARVVTPKAPTLYYHANRQALYWDEVVTQSPESFGELLRTDSVSYVLTTPVFGDYLTLLHLSLANCSRFDLVRAFSPATLLLAVRPESAPVIQNGPACRALARAERRGLAAARAGREQ